jgi:hypothetical protein
MSTRQEGPGAVSEFSEKARSIGVIGSRSGSTVNEGRDGQGRRFKATTDELGNTVTERHGDRVDVQIRPQTVTLGVQAA